MKTRAQWLTAAFALVGALAFAGCLLSGDDNHTPNVDDPSSNGADQRLATVAVDRRLVDGNTAFGVEICKRLAVPGENVFVSPASISQAFSMACNGAAGTTLDEMLGTLEFGDMTIDDLNAANRVLLSNLVYGDDKVTLEIANSLWARQEVSLYESFIDHLTHYYGAEARTVDFTSSSTPDVINAWVSDHTHGKIRSIVDRIPGNMVLYLINAVYFKGTWHAEFEESRTQDCDFTRADASTVQVPMMYQGGSYSYLATDDFQAVKLPYGDSSRFCMTIFLPAQTSSLAEFTESLTPEQWSTWQEQFSQMEGTVGLPRFEMEYKTPLIDPLTEMGMGRAFSPTAADFSGIMPLNADERLYISSAIHKTYLKVNEEGSEAAAVTAIGIAYPTSVGSTPPRFTMIMDRPFFISIVDERTGTILFMGDDLRSVVEAAGGAAPSHGRREGGMQMRRLPRFIFLSALAATLLTAGCSDDAMRLLNAAIDREFQGEAGGDGPSARLAREPVDARLVDGNTRFAFDLYHRLAQPGENVFFCPASISTALTMTYNGAAGETAIQMRDCARLLADEPGRRQRREQDSALEPDLRRRTGATEHRQ